MVENDSFKGNKVQDITINMFIIHSRKGCELT